MDSRSEEILAELAQLRALDAPTHGGRVMSYVYDADREDLDELASAAMRAAMPLNGLDPTTFPSIAAMERDLIGFARDMLNGDEDVVGSITSGGTESCMLAVKTARDHWRANGGEGRPRMVMPTTVHAAFHKAAHWLEVEVDLVPVSAETGAPDPADVLGRLGPDVAIVVLSAPSYPFATLDPIAQVAAGIGDAWLHVDACIGGWALPFWPTELPEWDLAIPGVTSIAADIHKYGYSPKGASVLLIRGRDRQRRQFFAITSWPGYPVVNPTMLGSRSAAPLAAAWAITKRLGVDGYRALIADAAGATAAIQAAARDIEGLRPVGEPTGPLVAVAADTSVPIDRQVDPHRWTDAMRRLGWVVQSQPSAPQPDGSRLPSTTHMTVTPVTHARVDELTSAMREAADAVRGVPHATPALPPLDPAALASGLDSEAAWALLSGFGLGEGVVPSESSDLLALIESLPAPLVERLLIELLGRIDEPA